MVGVPTRWPMGLMHEDLDLRSPAHQREQARAKSGSSISPPSLRAGSSSTRLEVDDDAVPTGAQPGGLPEVTAVGERDPTSPSPSGGEITITSWLSASVSRPARVHRTRCRSALVDRKRSSRCAYRSSLPPGSIGAERSRTDALSVSTIEQRSCRKDDRCAHRPAGGPVRVQASRPTRARADGATEAPGGDVRPHVERATDPDHDPSRRDGIRVPIIHRSCFGAPSPTRTIAGRTALIARVRSASLSAGASDPILGDGCSRADDLDAHAWQRSAPPICCLFGGVSRTSEEDDRCPAVGGHPEKHPTDLDSGPSRYAPPLARRLQPWRRRYRPEGPGRRCSSPPRRRDHREHARGSRGWA